MKKIIGFMIVLLLLAVGVAAEENRRIDIAGFSPAPLEQYAPGQGVEFKLKATENFDDGIASANEGFNIQFYTLDATKYTEEQMLKDETVGGEYISIDIVKEYNANFMSPYWTAKFNVPQEPGTYYTIFILYCGLTTEHSTCDTDTALRSSYPNNYPYSKHLIKYEVVQGDNIREKSIVAEIGEGETKIFVLDNVEYEVTVQIITEFARECKLKINGEITDAMAVGDVDILADGSKVEIRALTDSTVLFYLGRPEQVDTPEPIQPETPEPIQPEEKIDLSNYPDLFIWGKRLNTIFVVGDQAPADDVIAAIDISVSFQKYGVSKTGGAMLSSEVDHYKRNIISVGRPCDNAVTAQILRSNGIGDYNLDCSYGLKPGQARVYLFDYKGYAHMLVFGYSRLETRQMARALGVIDMTGTNWLHNFEGKNMPQPPAERPAPDPVRDIPECQEEIEQFKRELVEKYDSKNIPVPEELMKKYEEMLQSCRGDRHVPEPPVTEDRDEDCFGCRKNGACMQIGIRLLEKDEPVYCDIDNAFKPQRENNNVCMNNYECLSNTCQDGTCQSMGEQIKGIQKELAEQKSILEKIMGFFKRIFG